jgi:branched-chain amino acid transport system ATP-binding protein
MEALLARWGGAASDVDFMLFEAMLLYVENVPDHVHHPKEDAVLFPALMRHAIGGKQLVDELEHDHARGRVMLAALHDALRACRAGGIGGFDRLRQGVGQFAKFYDEHMWREEQQLLPLAVAHLPAEDWQCVERAFSENAVGFSAELANDYRRLFQCIAELMPSPLGSLLLGEMPRSTGI